MKETLQTQSSREILLYNAAYYKFIFKKTEKIVCALFFILKDSDKGQHSLTAQSLRSAAKKTLDDVIETLSFPLTGAQENIRGLTTSYIALQSNVRLAQADALIESVVADTISLEIETIVKSLRNYLVAEPHNPFDLSVEDIGGDAVRIPARTGLKEHGVPSLMNRESVGVQHMSRAYKGQLTPRKNAIKDILAAQPNATIKDISQKIKDCSEKTLQRELISMIKDGLVHKEGERRWSRYSLA